MSVAIGGAALYLTLGVLAGSLAARWRGSAADRGLVTSTLLVSSIPYYIVALMSWLYLVNEYQIFKSEYFPVTESPVKWATGLLLPWLVLGFTGATTYARFSRGSMVDSSGRTTCAPRRRKVCRQTEWSSSMPCVGQSSLW